MKFLHFSALAALLVLAAKPPPAASSDLGCQFMMCIAGNWRAVAECHPPVKTVLRGLARGRPIPACPMQGDGGTHAINQSTSIVGCPSIYTVWDDHPTCIYPGVISITVNQQHWGKVYWDGTGNTKSHWSEAAKRLLGQGDDYEQDVAAWNKTISRNCPGQARLGSDGLLRCPNPDN